MFLYKFILFTTLSSLCIFPQNDSLNSTQKAKASPYLNRALILAGGLAALDAGLWFYNSQVWYDHPTTKFHTFNDWYNSKLNVDKLGHIHMATVYTKMLKPAFEWAGFNRNDSYLYSSLTAWLFQLQMEIYDSFFAEWGFSWWDIASNTAGSFYPYLQQIYPPLKIVNLKYSYHPSNAYKDKSFTHFIADYEGTTYWLTLDLNEILPKQLDNLWPDWLNIAIGYGGENLVNQFGANEDINRRGLGKEEWYLAFDYNLIKIFNPDENTFLYQLLDFLNLFHLPSPTVRFSPSAIYYGIYF
jgi:hypothetical protein